MIIYFPKNGHKFWGCKLKSTTTNSISVNSDITFQLVCVRLHWLSMARFPKMSGQSGDIFRLYLQVYASGMRLRVVWIQVSKQSYKVTSSRINRRRPGTLKCSMQDRQNVQLCCRFHSSSTRRFFFHFFFCHSFMLGGYETSNICSDFCTVWTLKWDKDHKYPCFPCCRYETGVKLLAF